MIHDLSGADPNVRWEQGANQLSHEYLADCASESGMFELGCMPRCRQSTLNPKLEIIDKEWIRHSLRGSKCWLLGYSEVRAG